MLKTKTDNPNYLAKVVKLKTLKPHPNADRLQIALIDFQNVITGLDAKEGDLYVYFPLECKINKDFLSYSNAFSDKNLNADKEQKGFFTKSGRVKATKLRQVLSEGYIHPADKVNEWLSHVGIDYQITESDEDKSFDSFGDLLFVEKYVTPRKGGLAGKQQKKARRESKLVENQFRLHVDTENLKRNMFKISPDDWISISFKIHGTSFVGARVLCKKKLSVIEKILKFCGVNIIDTQYDDVVSSRKVIKNCYADKVHNSFYDFDIWMDAHKRLEGKILDGISLYAEIVGFMPTGSAIQKDYDYGCKESDYEIYVYRITYTNNQGRVFEFNTDQINRYCEKFEIKRTPVFYIGYAKDKYDLSLDDHWHENFLEKLAEEYNEKDCYMCSNKVPEEGIVLRKENAEVFEAYKLKSVRFLEKESKDLDNGEQNVEDEVENAN